MRRNCNNCQFVIYAKGVAPPLPLCLNKHGEADSIWGVKLADTCRNFLAKPIPRKKITQPTDPSIRLIPLTQGRVAIVDAEDYQRISKSKWHLLTKGKIGYALRQEGRKTLLMHRYLTNCPKGLVVDHIDGNGLNNTKANLRICTQKQNACNTPGHVGKSSKYKGVKKMKNSNKFRAAITNNRKYFHLGVFEDETEAARAYDEAARKYHKEFAYLNFPE